MTNPHPQSIDLPLKGPGLIESMMWVSGYHLAQVLAGGLLLLVLLLIAFDGLPSDWSEFEQFVSLWDRGQLDRLLSMMIGCATLGSLFLVLPLTFWRMRPDPRRAFGMQVPTGRQLVLLTGAVVPLGILSDELYRCTSLMMAEVQEMLATQWPILASLKLHEDTISIVHGQTSLTAYPQLLVIVGVGPAIGEEFVFRGLIGRGLIARWGVVRGILLTSLLFATAHLSPSHALATLPIAVFLHVTYLATGSLWAPIFVHFLNNALSITMMKYELGQNVQVSLILIASSVVYVTAIALLLLRNELPALGLRWASPVMRANQPCAAGLLGDVPSVARSPSWLILVAGTGVLCFTWSFVTAASAAATL